MSVCFFLFYLLYCCILIEENVPLISNSFFKFDLMSSKINHGFQVKATSQYDVNIRYLMLGF